ncbi:unnamed protein product [Periconia digitata]|uniref:Uncharacterized protein n=1 Tax=Periconia digitata TaxID=1303443 RepID=A0A9W4UBV6_9PLEO|nr:unnamed protein product [Periconia digitata]
MSSNGAACTEYVSFDKHLSLMGRVDSSHAGTRSLIHFHSESIVEEHIPRSRARPRNRFPFRIWAVFSMPCG